MQETAVEQPDPPAANEVVAEAPQEAPQEAPDPPELAFTDAASATRWVKALPLSNVAQAYQLLVEQLQAALPLAQVNNRIPDDLPGTVVGNVAATIGRMELDPGAAEYIFIRQQVLHAAIAPKRDYMRVFDEQKLVRNFAALTLLSGAALSVKCLRVSHAPEIAHDQITH